MYEYDYYGIGKIIAGDVGESYAYRLISKSIVITGYKRVLKNVFVPLKCSSKYTEIDVILIHETGIYVVEVKNYIGWISGTVSNPYWFQFQKDKPNKRFFNPIIQNKNHIKALKRYLRGKYTYEPVSVIVFGSDCKFSKVPKNTTELIITHMSDLTRDIQKIIVKRRSVLNSDEVNKLYEIMRTLT